MSPLTSLRSRAVSPLSSLRSSAISPLELGPELGVVALQLGSKLRNVRLELGSKLLDIALDLSFENPKGRDLVSARNSRISARSAEVASVTSRLRGSLRGVYHAFHRLLREILVGTGVDQCPVERCCSHVFLPWVVLVAARSRAAAPDDNMNGCRNPARAAAGSVIVPGR